MVQVIYRIKDDPEIKTARMFSPKKISSTDAWYKSARAVLPQIPDIKRSDWYISDVEATINHIKYTLHNGIAQTAYVTIDRTQKLGPMDR